MTRTSSSPRLHRALDGWRDPVRETHVDELAAQLRDGGEDVVIVYSERIGASARPASCGSPQRLELGDHPGAGLLAIPAGANGRGLREAGACPDAGPATPSCRAGPAAAPPRSPRRSPPAS